MGEDLAQATTFLAGLTGMDVLTDEDLNGNHAEVRICRRFFSVVSLSALRQF